MRRPLAWCVMYIGLGASVAPSLRAADTAGSFKAFAVYSHEAGMKTHYVPSGYMGDSDVTLSVASIKAEDGKEDACLKLNYRASGPKGWMGIYWQDPANNWGERPGKAGYDLRGAERLTFRARGESGGERVKEFRVGGITGKYPDSDIATLTGVKLTKDWQRFTIDLKGKDLRHIIGGFAVFLSKAENAGGSVIYIDDVVYEGAGMTQGVAEGADPAIGKPPAPAPTPTPVAVQAPAPVKPANTEDLDVKEVDGGLKVSFSQRLMFASNKALLEGQSGKVLDQLVKLLEAYPKSNVVIEGHTDNLGDKNYNLKLSELRALAVRDYLIKQGGYDKARFQVTGYGDTKPIADNKTKAGRSLNRRVEVTILKAPNA